jgi:hypothetical protein
MGKLYFYSFICFFISLSDYHGISQTIIDKDKTPIPFVNIRISSKANHVWQSDSKGEIPKNLIPELSDSDSLALQHISYEIKKLSKKELLQNDSIYLEHKNYNISVFEVSQKPPKYHLINACFRSTVVQDSEPIYYSDGRASYFASNKRLKYDLKRFVYRVFEHVKIERFIVTHKTSYEEGNAKTPSLLKKFLPHQLIYKHKLLVHTQDSVNYKILTPDSLKIGELNRLENRIDYRIDYGILNSYANKEMKILKTEAFISDQIIFMSFRAKEGVEPNDIKNFENLLVYTYSYKSRLKHENDKKTRHYEVYKTLFVEDFTYLDQKDQEYDDRYGMPRKSLYSSPFWENCNCELYYYDFEFLKSMNEL